MHNGHVKPSVKSSPDHSILYVGTNDLPPNKSCHKMSIMSIMSLAISIKNEKHDICISNMIIRADDKKLEEKRCDRKVLN